MVDLIKGRKSYQLEREAAQKLPKIECGNARKMEVLRFRD